jgi:hypothetical protein
MESNRTEKLIIGDPMPENNQLTLNCWILGSKCETAFYVEIMADCNVYKLKKAIKEEGGSIFQSFSALQLSLWQVGHRDNLRLQL